jgi:hypothetical protein
MRGALRLVKDILGRLTVTIILVPTISLGVVDTPQTVLAAPLGQNFTCTDAGIPSSAGLHTCWNWTTPAAEANPGGIITWNHDCGANFVVSQWWYHWEGASFSVIHTFEHNGSFINVQGQNDGGGPGHFWVTGRCKSR